MEEGRHGTFKLNFKRKEIIFSRVSSGLRKATNNLIDTRLVLPCFNVHIDTRQLAVMYGILLQNHC